MKFILSTLILLGFSSAFQSISHKRKILIMDSGLNLSIKLKPYLCESGHKSFLEGKRSNPFEDETGHGTLISTIISEGIDPSKHCIVIYRTFAKEGGLVSTQAYATGLIEAKKHKYDAIVIAMEDEGYYLEEVKLFKELTKHARIFVAAGNGRKNLDLKCNVYPACLADQIKSENFRVVGDLNHEFNSGSLINEREESRYNRHSFDTHGTSVSTAHAAARYVSQSESSAKSVLIRKISSK